MSTTTKHYVTFYSPGTMFDESTSYEIDAWEPKAAMALLEAKPIEERYGAKPYCFVFDTRIVSEDIPDGRGGKLRVEPKTVETSGRYYINGRVRSVDDVERDADPKESILRSNMQCNDWAYICETRNSYRHTGTYSDRDCIVDASGNVTDTGDSAERRAYRRQKTAEYNARFHIPPEDQ